jgi:DNA-binding CsgD family transcriptional regulator
MSNLNLALEIARLEAKVDVLINLVSNLNVPHHPAPPKVEQPLQLNASQVGVMRDMSPRQHAALQLLIQGWQNNQMSELMGVTESTVKMHVKKVCDRFGVKTRGQAAMLGQEIINMMPKDDYTRYSGGFPPDWGASLSSAEGTDDAYYQLYKPTRI